MYEAGGYIDDQGMLRSYKEGVRRNFQLIHNTAATLGKVPVMLSADDFLDGGFEERLVLSVHSLTHTHAPTRTRTDTHTYKHRPRSSCSVSVSASHAVPLPMLVQSEVHMVCACVCLRHRCVILYVAHLASRLLELSVEKRACHVIVTALRQCVWERKYGECDRCATVPITHQKWIPFVSLAFRPHNVSDLWCVLLCVTHSCHMPCGYELMLSVLRVSVHHRA